MGKSFDGYVLMLEIDPMDGFQSCVP